MRVGKWDDSLAVRLPPLVVELLGLEEGDEVRIEVAGDRVLRVRPVEPAAAPSTQAAAEPACEPERRLSRSRASSSSRPATCISGLRRASGAGS